MSKKADPFDQIGKLLRSLQGQETLKHVVERVFQRIPTLTSRLDLLSYY